MSTPSEWDNDIPAEIDFSGGERGKFYRPNAVLILPACHDGNQNPHVPAETRESGEKGK